MNNLLRTLWIIFKKEWRDAIRDKRSLRMAFLPPFYFVGMFVGTFFLILHLQTQASGRGSEPIKLPVSGAEHLPALTDWLQEQGFNIIPVGEDAYAQVEQKKIDYALIIPIDAKQQFAVGEPAVTWLVYDATNSKMQTSISFIKQNIWGWNSRMGSLRLLSRGISPAIANPILLREMNIASDQKMGFFIMSSLPMCLILLVFIASVGFTADMTAGERERHSLEALLITPAKSLEIVMGKWLACLMLTFAVLLVEIVLFIPAFSFIPFNKLGLRVDVSIGDLSAIFFSLMSLAVVAVALQQVVAIFARSFKDAQTFMALLIVIPTVPTIYMLINPGAAEPWFAWVPILAHHVVVKELLLGGSLDMMSLVKCWIVALPIAACLLLFTAAALRKPVIVYG